MLFVDNLLKSILCKNCLFADDLKTFTYVGCTNDFFISKLRILSQEGTW